jgi:hypothetical protein
MTSGESTASNPVKIRGRVFSPEDITLIRSVIASSPGGTRRLLSAKVCHALNWYQDNGRPKDRPCRDVLRRLETLGMLTLPPTRPRTRRGRSAAKTEHIHPRLPFALSPKDIQLDSFAIVNGARAHRLWNEYVATYHYLGYGVPVGPNLKYFVEVRGEPVACLAFSGAAWKVAPRDTWIGWTREQREKNLRHIVNNTRFLILPWITVKNLASRILALAIRRLPADWLARYAYRPLLIETFVHSDRHAGTCYKAANWICVGETQGRGRMDRFKERALPKKAIFLYPITPHARSFLATAKPLATPTGLQQSEGLSGA